MQDQYHAACIVAKKSIKESASVNQYPGTHIFSVQKDLGTERYSLDPDNDPIRDHMIREFPDDVMTR